MPAKKKSTLKPASKQSASESGISGADYILKITLLDIKPKVWRRVRVPGDILLGDLHRVIQAVMPWYECHLNLFILRDGTEICKIYGDEEEAAECGPMPLDETKTQLSQLVGTQRSKFLFIYDFGDDWRHEIEVEKIVPKDSGSVLTHCMDGERACPPEDCGGPWGYAEILRALRDPEHVEHNFFLEWFGKKFDPEAFDRDEANRRLHLL